LIRPFLIMTALLASLLPRECDEEQKYRVLSFFFDGVPLPPSMQVVVVDTTATTDSTQAKPVKLAFTRPPEPTIFVHKPYSERRCQDCHKGEFGQSLIEPRVDLVCQHCHEQFRQMPTYIHGPVAVGQCTRCHNPHKTKYEHLLVKDGSEVCLQCHEAIDRERVTAHQDLTAKECFDCHNPHYSSTNRFFLTVVQPDS